MNNTQAIKKAITICSIIAIVIMAGIMIITSAYTVFAADDYTHADSIGALHVGFFSYIWASLRYMKAMWMTWQGTYFAMFLQALLSPINNFGMPQLRIVMLLNSILLFVTVIVFIHTALRNIGKENAYAKWLVSALVVFAITNYSVYIEIYLWYSGSTSYSFPLSMLMIAMTAFLKMSDSDKKVHFVIALLFGFAAMGGTLCISAMGCFAAMLICIYRSLEKKTWKLKSNIVFVVWVLGALANTLAPGNFRRQGIILDLYGQITYTGIKPIDAVFVTMDTLSQQIITYVTSTNIVFILVVTFVAAYTMNRNENVVDVKKVILSACGLLTPFFLLFPYCLANLSTKMQNRVDFLVVFVVLLSYMQFAFVLGQTVRAVTADNVRTISALLIVFALFVGLSDRYGFLNYAERNVVTSLMKGEYQNYYKANKEFVARLDTYEKGSDVIIYTEEGEFPVPITYTFNFYLYDDANNGVNKAIAHIYDFNSIAIGWR